MIFSLVAFSTLLSVNLFPVLTNDSLTYLEYSHTVGDFGLVHLGYRQFGYPLFLWLSELPADWVSIEPLLFAAFVQRLLLVVGLVYSIWLWRWWSLPIVLFALTAELIAYTNLILTEGLTISLTLILVCVTAHVFKIRANHELEAARGLAITLVAVAALLAFGLFAIRFPFAVFGIGPLVVALSLRATNLNRPAWVAFAAFLASSLLLVGLLSVENARELGTWAPSTGGARTEYWAVWSSVFSLEAGNRSDPSLREFYAGGDPYTFIHEVDSMDSDQQTVAFRKAIDDLLGAAGIGPWQSRFEALVGALRGGRLDDIESTVRNVLSSDRTNVDSVIHSNGFTRVEGPNAFADRFNQGQIPDAVITAPLALRLPLPTASGLASFLLPLSLLVLMWGLTSRGPRLLAAAGLAAAVAYLSFVAYIRADNFRFLVTIMVFGITCGSAVLALRGGPIDPIKVDSDRVGPSQAPGRGIPEVRPSSDERPSLRG